MAVPLVNAAAAVAPAPLPYNGPHLEVPADPHPLSRQVRQIRQIPDDVVGAYSGYGSDHVVYCEEGIPIKQALFALLAAFAASFGFLYRAITQITGGRKKRALGDDSTWAERAFMVLADMAWLGRSYRLWPNQHDMIPAQAARRHSFTQPEYVYMM